METERGFFNVSVGNLLDPRPQGSGIVKTSVRLLSNTVKQGHSIDRASRYVVVPVAPCSLPRGELSRFSFMPQDPCNTFSVSRSCQFKIQGPTCGGSRGGAPDGPRVPRVTRDWARSSEVKGKLQRGFSKEWSIHR